MKLVRITQVLKLYVCTYCRYTFFVSPGTKVHVLSTMYVQHAQLTAYIHVCIAVHTTHWCWRYSFSTHTITAVTAVTTVTRLSTVTRFTTVTRLTRLTRRSGVEGDGGLQGPGKGGEDTRSVSRQPLNRVAL